MRSVPQSGLHEIGIIIKAQGTLGGFILEITHPAIQLNDIPELVYIRYPDHQWQPYRVEAARVHQDRKRKLFFVILKGIYTRTEAEKLRNHLVMTDINLELPPVEPDVIGYLAVRADRTQIGVVSDLLETPAYDILVVSSNPETNKTLIPWIDEFVSEVDHKGCLVITKNTSDLENLN